MKSDFSMATAALARMRKAIDNGVKRAAGELVRVTKNKLKGGVKSGTLAHAYPGQPPYSKTGDLRRGVGQTPVVGGHCRVVSRARYSRIQERGGVIHAKSKKYLPIPLNWEAYRMQQRLGQGGSLKSYNLDFIPNKPGRSPFLGKITGKGKRQKIKRLFVLKRSAMIRPHPFMAPSIEQARPKMIAHIQAAGRQIMRGYK